MRARSWICVLAAMAGSIGQIQADDAPRKLNPRPTIVVVASYPGANARTVEDAVAAPIEREMAGVQGMTSMRSCCTSGKYTLAVEFEPGTDMSMAEIPGFSRARLALSVLPLAVQRQGIEVRKEIPFAVMIVDVTSSDVISSDQKRDVRSLTSLANKDMWSRTVGVAEVVACGEAFARIRIKLRPGMLRALDLTPDDISKTLEKEKYQVTGGKTEKPPIPDRRPLLDPSRAVLPKNMGIIDMAIETAGVRLADAGKIADIVVKTTADGKTVRLKDVGDVELAPDVTGEARANGKPAVSLFIYPLPNSRPDELAKALREKADSVRKTVPEDVRIFIDFYFTSNLRSSTQPAISDVLLLDVDFLSTSTPESTGALLAKYGNTLREIKGVKDVLTLTSHPFDLDREKPCVLVRLAPSEKRENLVKTIRERLPRAIPGVAVRVRDLSNLQSFPGYPIDFALTGPDRDQLRKRSEQLAARLRKNDKLLDVGLTDTSPKPELHIDIDRDLCTKLDVKVSDVLDALSFNAEADFVGPGAKGVELTDDKQTRAEKNIKLIQVRNALGQLVPLNTLVKVKRVEGVRVLQRLNGYLAVEVTANPADGVSIDQARALCEKEAEETLPRGYKLVWMRE